MNTNRRKRIRKRKKWIKNHRVLFYAGSVTFFIVVCLILFFAIKTVCAKINDGSDKVENKNSLARPELDVDLLTINEYSRPAEALKNINGIVIHYTANPGSTAKQNRDYFESLKDTKKTKASSHFVIGLDGEIVQCIPSSEISYASNDRNYDTISIECCHVDETGKLNKKTYKSLVRLTAWLCVEFDVSPDSVIRHYDVTGKNCPKYFVEHDDEWSEFKSDVKKYIKKGHF